MKLSMENSMEGILREGGGMRYSSNPFLSFPATFKHDRYCLLLSNTCKLNEHLLCMLEKQPLHLLLLYVGDDH